MKNGHLRLWVLLMALAILALPARGFAQSGSPSEQPFFRWDVAGGFGVLVVEEDDLTIKWNELSGELGRFGRRIEDLHPRVEPGRRQIPVFAGSTRLPRDADLGWRGGFVGHLTSQFRENVFSHPYVLAGVRLTWLSDTIVTTPSVPPYPSVTEVTPTRLDAHRYSGAAPNGIFHWPRVLPDGTAGRLADPHAGLST